jgi:hypothetical protein
VPTWTFTTSNPDTALKLSTFCVGLGYVTERETPDAPAKLPARPKAAPVDHGCWTDPEARGVRAKAQAWGRKPTQNVNVTVKRTHDAVQDYADAMGWSHEVAEAKVRAHEAHLAANPPVYSW